MQIFSLEDVLFLLFLFFFDQIHYKAYGASPAWPLP